MKAIIFAASFASLLSPLSGQIYFPALNSVAGNLHVSDSLVNLSITTYLVSPFSLCFLILYSGPLLTLQQWSSISR